MKQLKHRRSNIFMNNKKYFTHDLGLACVLVTLGYPLIELEKSNPKRVGFVFKRGAGIEKVIDDFFSNQLMLPALSLLSNQKNLKSRIYSNN